MPRQAEIPCAHNRRSKDRLIFMSIASLAIGLAVCFGYMVASIHFQRTFIKMTQTHANERTQLHRRYMGQMNAKDIQIRQIRQGEIK
jgi:hypothetical protein